MKTKNIFKALALAMLMPAMLLTTACSNQDDIANTSNITSKGYALPVTVNATRGGDATRATFDGSKLNFGTGDKLFVSGSATGAGSFAGALDYVPATGKFSGTIYTQNQWLGTADALFTAASAGEAIDATLLPNGYDSYTFLSILEESPALYDDRVDAFGWNAFVASETAKATGVEQLSYERATTYSSGFALAPVCAILNFTISGLEAVAQVVTLDVTRMGSEYTVTGSVTPNASGVATFAIGVPGGFSIKDVSMSNNLSVGSHNFTLPGGTALAAGKIYNITRGTGATVDLSTINANYTASNGVTLTGTLGANVMISIADGATVILNNVTINGTTSNDYQWAGITCLGDATIILSGTNTVKGFYENYPGIQAAAGKTLTIQGTGSLTASSNGFGAGIGGGYFISCGNIVINGGSIVVTGGDYAAGIGGCGWGCGNITISGGSITANGGLSAAGIGTGNGETCGNITISGGSITANGGANGAGIGTGLGGNCGSITIYNTVTSVTATKGTDAPCSIGKGKDAYYTPSTCGTVIIGGIVGAITTSPYTYQP